MWRVLKVFLLLLWVARVFCLFSFSCRFIFVVFSFSCRFIFVFVSWLLLLASSVGAFWWCSVRSVHWRVYFKTKTSNGTNLRRRRYFANKSNIWADIFWGRSSRISAQFSIFIEGLAWRGACVVSRGSLVWQNRTCKQWASFATGLAVVQGGYNDEMYPEVQLSGWKAHARTSWGSQLLTCMETRIVTRAKACKVLEKNLGLGFGCQKDHGIPGLFPWGYQLRFTDHQVDEYSLRGHQYVKTWTLSNSLPHKKLEANHLKPDMVWVHKSGWLRLVMGDGVFKQNLSNLWVKDMEICLVLVHFDPLSTFDLDICL